MFWNEDSENHWHRAWEIKFCLFFNESLQESGKFENNGKNQKEQSFYSDLKQCGKVTLVEIIVYNVVLFLCLWKMFHPQFWFVLGKQPESPHTHPQIQSHVLNLHPVLYCIPQMVGKNRQNKSEYIIVFYSYRTFCNMMFQHLVNKKLSLLLYIAGLIHVWMAHTHRQRLVFIECAVRCRKTVSLLTRWPWKRAKTKIAMIVICARLAPSPSWI